MEYQISEKNNRQYIEVVDGSQKLASEQEALDLVAICGEHRLPRLMIHAENLTEDFYHLSTGVAGAILQKFVNYQIRVAAVLPPEKASQGKFGEMVLESNRGNQFRVYSTRGEAEDWLTRA
ncbi:MAG TPA: DUF4180 domain-containing protein [Anaerolineaceae bacterium]|nr:DUF4180 domain-containing protein [Anaerolineaceae bacterium]